MKRKRWVAVFLSLVLVLSMGMPVSAKGYSKNSNSSRNKYSWELTNEKSSADDKETSGNEVVSDDNTVVDESTVEETTQPEDEITVEEETSGETTVAESETATEETSEDVENSNENSVFPAQDFSGEANDVAVTVNAPEGAFPEGTTMNVTEAEESSVQAAADAVNASTSDVTAVEITFTVNGEEIEPAVPVKVTLDSVQIADMEAPVVVHVDDEAQAEVIADTTVENGAVSFDADEFSAYAVAAARNDNNDETAAADSADDNANVNYIVSINYVFEDNAQAAQTWSASLAKNSTYSNTVAYPEVVGYAPETPTGLPNGVTANENGITFDLTVQSDIEINVIYKPAEVNYTVNYYQQNVDDDNYTLADTETKTGLTGSTIGVTYEGVKDKYEGFYGLLFDESATIAADGSTVVEIYYDRNYYLMSFDLDGGYGVEPIYARYGASISVAAPEKPGHSFSGWSENIPKTMPAENTTFTALWDAEEVNYTVVFWYENANDDNYSYAGSLTDSATAGSTIQSGSYQNRNFDGRDNTHFTYNGAMAESKTVAGDGSTVLNVYFTRNEYTLTFKSGTGRYATTYGTITAKYQANIADQWPTAGTYMSGSHTQVPTNLYYWAFTSVLTGDDVLQATKIYTMTADVCNSRGLTLVAHTDGNLRQYTVNYWMESLDGTGTLHDGVYYTKSNEYSQTLNYTRNQNTWGYKTIDGFQAEGETAYNNNNTFNLYYSRNRNNITFYDNHGTTVASISNVMYEMPLSNVTYNGSAISSIVPAYPSDLEPGAYEFGGWYTTAGCYDGTEADFTNGTMPNANLAFYAKWVPVTHTVNTYFDSNCEAEGLLKTQTVSHGSFAEAPEQPENGLYTFVGWFYMDNGTEKAFSFDSMPVRKDLNIYAKWSSNVLVEYTINYETQDGTVIADPTTGSALAGTTKTFEAKTEGDLYDGYQTGYFPTVSSHSLTLDINGGENNVFTFVYKPATKVPYTVKYVDAESGESLADDKVVNDNTYAVVTETAATISGYLPDAFQKRLILTVPESGEPTADDNVLTFYYTADSVHAIVSTTYYLVDGDVTTQYQHNEETGTIGQTYTREALSISGYSLDHVTINGEVWTEDGDPTAKLTAEGLNFEFYYTPDYFYVYHSSNQSVDSVRMPASGTYDITAAVKDGYLYGGYYSSYKKAGSYAGGPTATYDGTSYKGAIAGYWDSKAAYTANGTTMQPVKGKTYYLKEVPDDYFKPGMALVYDTYTDPYNAVGLYLISATDDKNYTDFGLQITSTIAGVNGYEQVKEYALSFKVQQKVNVSDTTTFTAKSAFGVPNGYLGVWDAGIELVLNNNFSYTPYVVTPDGVTVTGTTSRTVYAGDVTYRNTLDNGPGVYKVDN